MEDFKHEWSLFERQRESRRLRNKYPDRISIVIYPGPRGPPIDKNKYLVPSVLTFGEFMHIIRKRMTKINPHQALVGFVNGVILPPSSRQLKEIYQECADPDGFLYVTYTLENTFGG